MRRGPNHGYWRPAIQREPIPYWLRRELTAGVTTRSGLNTSALKGSGSSSDEDTTTQAKKEQGDTEEPKLEIEVMANMEEDDPEIGSLNSHAEGEPPQAIAITAGITACDVKPHVISVLPPFNGRSYDDPYGFLHEFSKICKAQKRPAGSTEDDYRLKALPFALKGEANTWFMRLPPNSIRTWADFKRVFLKQFFPSTRTSALKKEILGVTQDYDETLSEYWARFMNLLDAYPNHRMSEAEQYSTFYEEINIETKDLVNSSSGGGFPHLRVSEGKKVMERLLSAKKA